MRQSFSVIHATVSVLTGYASLNLISASLIISLCMLSVSCVTNRASYSFWKSRRLALNDSDLAFLRRRMRDRRA